ncbi:MAG: rhodanese-like domain-containing protein [Thermoanaerobaculia bacterium]
MKSTLLILSALALAAGCSGEKTVPPSPVAAAVTSQAAPEAAPPPRPAAPAAEIPEVRPVPAEGTSARIAVPSTVPDVPAAKPEPEPGRIGAAELAPLVASGEAILVDVRSEAEWRSGHAQGAMHIPYRELFERSVELPHEALIALYCT